MAHNLWYDTINQLKLLIDNAHVGYGVVYAHTTNLQYITSCLINKIDQASFKPTSTWSIVVLRANEQS